MVLNFGVKWCSKWISSWCINGPLKTYENINSLILLDENSAYKIGIASLLTLPVFGAMIGQILHGHNGMGCAVSAMTDAVEEHDNGNSALNYDPTRRYDFKVEDVEYRRDSDQSWLAHGVPAAGQRTVPGAGRHPWRCLGIMAIVRTTRRSPKGWRRCGRRLHRLPLRGQYPYPSSLADINYATRWLKVHAADFNARRGNRRRAGRLSGGHLILLSAMRPFDPRYTALPLAGTNGVDGTLAYAISCWGVLDPLGRYRMAEANGNKDLMANHERYFLTVDTMQESNIIHVLQSGEKVELPPALLIQGTADKGVPQGMVKKRRVCIAPQGTWSWRYSRICPMVLRVGRARGEEHDRAHEEFHRAASDCGCRGALKWVKREALL